MAQSKISVMRVKLDVMLKMFQLVQAQDLFNYENMFFRSQRIK